MFAILFNAGSSSLKASLFVLDGSEPIAQAHADWAGASTKYHYSVDGKPQTSEFDWRGHRQAVGRFLEDLRSHPPAGFALEQLRAAAHRIVHGGDFTKPVLITPEIRRQIAELADLAPLHNPPSLDALTAAEVELDGVPQIAVFDTEFHSTLPQTARVYPIPRQWTDEWRIR